MAWPIVLTSWLVRSLRAHPAGAVIVVTAAPWSNVTCASNRSFVVAPAGLAITRVVSPPEAFAAATEPTLVIVGAFGFHVTVLSVLVDAVLALPAGSVTAPAGIDATTDPNVVIPVTATV